MPTRKRDDGKKPSPFVSIQPLGNREGILFPAGGIFVAQALLFLGDEERRCARPAAFGLNEGITAAEGTHKQYL